MKKTLFLLWAGMLCWTGAQAEIINHAYDGSKTAEQNGDALETTISGAKSGDSIKVQAGTYQGNFTFEAGVNVSGGWNSTFTEQTDYATILDANRNGRPVSSTTNLSKLTVWSNLTLQNGKPDDGGGGAYLRQNARLDHCLIQNNTTGGSNQAGGGVQLYKGGQLYNCIVRNDTATGDCGGVRINGAAGKVINCLIYGNEANNKCGGLRAEVGSDIIGNTIVGNNQKTDTDGNNSHCGLSLTMSENISDGSLLANNIIWGNKHKGNVSSAQIYYISRYPAANRANNAVYNQNTGTGSINLLAEDPGFVDAEHGDYRLIATSQLVDAGDDDSMIDTKDLLGNPRKAGSHVDIGANEFAKVLDGDDLQEFIDASVAGTTVYIQAGTFTGNFTMREGVNVSGGWNSTFNAQTGETILDADHSGRPLTQDADFTTETTWSNFTLTNGSMDGDGGGAYLQENGVLMNCKIISNTATNAGGVCMHGKGKLANCLVVNNTATNANGGVSIESALSDVINNTIVNNNQLVGTGAQAGVKIQNDLSSNGTYFVNVPLWLRNRCIILPKPSNQNCSLCIIC